MNVNDELIDKLAHLARLDFDEKEKKEIGKDLQNMILFVEKLNEVDTEGVEPLIYISEERNVWREDEAKQTLTHAEALKNAPVKDSDYIKVPKVLKK